MIKILFIGDVVSEPGCNTVRNLLPKIKRENNIDLVIANAENSAKGNGISVKSANHLFESGCDILTGGNHSLKRREIYNMLNENDYILRPHNISRSCPGKGVCIYDKGEYSIAVVNLMGQTYLDTNSSPFETINNISPMTRPTPPIKTANLGPKKCSTIPPKKQNMLIHRDIIG